MKRMIDVVTIVALVYIAAVIVLDRVNVDHSVAGEPRVESSTPADLSPITFAQLAARESRLGSEDAPVLAVIFSDYACGFCVELDESLWALRARYPDHFSAVIRHFVRWPASDNRAVQRVALGAECAAEQGMFEQYHRAAFAAGRAVQYTDGWRAIAAAAAVPNMRKLEACVRSLAVADKLAEDMQFAQRLHVNATPTMFINGRRVVGAIPLPQLDSMVAAALRPSRGLKPRE